jgi:hypothetical protein
MYANITISYCENTIFIDIYVQMFITYVVCYVWKQYLNIHSKQNFNSNFNQIIMNIIEIMIDNSLKSIWHLYTILTNKIMFVVLHMKHSIIYLWLFMKCHIYVYIHTYLFHKIILFWVVLITSSLTVACFKPINPWRLRSYTKLIILLIHFIRTKSY